MRRNSDRPACVATKHAQNYAVGPDDETWARLLPNEGPGAGYDLVRYVPVALWVGDT
jgi:hypothetical protein